MAELAADTPEEGGKGSKSSFRRVRSRAARACEVCHSRKVRCDVVTHQPCTNCVAFGCECRVPEPRQVRRHSTASAKHSSQSSVLSSRANDEDLRAGTKRDLASTSPESQRPAKLGLHGQWFLGSSTSIPPSLMTSKEGVGLAENMDYFLGCLPVSLYTDDDATIASLECRGAFKLPPKQLCDELVEDYFTYIHPEVPIIDKQKFLDAYKLEPRPTHPSKDNQPSIMLFQAMLCAASRVCLNRALEDSNGSTLAFTRKLYGRAKALFDAEYERDPIVNICVASLLSLSIDMPSLIKHNAYYWSRVAVAMAVGIGLHRRVDDAGSAKKSSMRRRIWWSLYWRDISAATAYGRPIMINLEESDVDLVTESDFFDDPNHLNAQHFIALVRLHEIMAAVARTQYSVGAERLRKLDKLPDVTTLDMALAQWANQLPHVLRYSIKDPHRHEYLRANLYLKYYTVLCLAHRPQVVHLFRFRNANRAYPSWGIAFQAAHMIDKILENLKDHNEVRRLPTVAAYSVFSAVIMLMYQAESLAPQVVRVAQKALDDLVETLRELSVTTEIAGWIMVMANSLRKNPRVRDHFARTMKNRDTSKWSPAAVIPEESQVDSADAPKSQASKLSGSAIELPMAVPDPRDVVFSTFEESRTPSTDFNPETLFPEGVEDLHGSPGELLIPAIGEASHIDEQLDGDTMPESLGMDEWYDFLVSTANPATL